MKTAKVRRSASMRRRRASLEALEDRRLLSTFTVTNTDDSGPGSLRQAILDSNGANGADTIAFDIPGSGVRVINPTSALPEITDPVTIDGYTQTGAHANTLTVGTNATLLIQTPLPRISAGSSTIRGLVIPGNLVLSTHDGNVVEGCFLGTNADGSAPASGSSTTPGLRISSSGNRIGGTSPDARNLISGNGAVGLVISPGASNNVVQGNLIGTDATGSKALGNAGGGVQVGGPNSQMSSDSNSIGGSVAGAGNVISGNLDAGMGIFAASGTVVQGNLVGTSADGLLGLGNRSVGIGILGSASTLIGGSTSAAQNVVSANGGPGIYVDSPGAGLVISGNLIGLKSNGYSPLGNAGAGVDIHQTSNPIMVGGPVPDQGNTIRYNEAPGVLVEAGSGVSVLSNSIASNSGLGLDLGGDGVTLNDTNTQDSDSGVNGRQNFPVITSIDSSGSGSTVNGTLDSTASTLFHLQFFANSFPDPSGYGEGQTFLGQIDVTTDASGQATFSATLNSPIAPGKMVTATATDPSGNTSEFSLAVPYQTASTLDVSTRIDVSTNSAAVGETFTYTVTVTNAGTSASPSTDTNLVLGLPSNASLVSASSSQGTVSGSTPGALEATLNTIPIGQSATVTVVVKAQSPGTARLTAHASGAQTDTNPSNNTSEQSVTVVAAPDLALTSSTSPASPSTDQNLTFTYTVTNSSASTEARNVVVTTNALPSGLFVVSQSASQGSASASNGVVSAQVGTLAPGASATVTVVVQAASVGTYTLPATVTSSGADPNTGNNTTSPSVTVAAPVPHADLSLNIQAVPQPATVGQALAYVLTVTNNGPDDSIGTVLTAQLPAGSTFLAATFGAAKNGVYVLPFIPLAPGQSVSIVVAVTPGMAGSATLSASVTEDTNDPDPSNNSASATVVVNQPVTATITSTQAYAIQGSVRGFVLHVNGPLNLVSATNPNSYKVVTAGRDGLFGTGDDTRVIISSATYNPFASTVTLITRARFRQNQFTLVTANGSGPNALLAASGVPIDGNNNGLPGGDYNVSVGLGRRLTYIDSTGDLVNLRLIGLGSMEMERALSGEAETLRLVSTFPSRSTLAGSVTRTGLGGDGVTYIPVVLGLETVRNRLGNPPFLLGQTASVKSVAQETSVSTASVTPGQKWVAPWWNG